MSPDIRVRFIVGIIFPRHSARLKFVCKHIIKRNHRKTVRFAYFRHIRLAGVSAFYYREIKSNSRFALLGQCLAYKCLIAVFVNLIVSIVYGKFNKDKIGVVVKDITLKTDIAEYTRSAAQTGIDIVYLVIGVHLAKAVVGKLSPAFFRACRKTFGDTASDKCDSYFLAAVQLFKKLRHALHIAKIHKRSVYHIGIYLLLCKRAFVYAMRFGGNCFGGNLFRRNRFG